jgi:uncharacterized protein (DUF608 family)
MTGTAAGASLLGAAQDAALAAGQPAPAEPTSLPQSAVARGVAIPYPRRFTGRHLRMIGFPMGGVGTGCISLGGRGQLRDWEIFNRPDKGNAPNYCIFTVWAQRGDGVPVARVLESRILPPYETTPRGLWLSNAPGLPRLAGATFEGDYPFARIRFSDRKLPVEIRLEAFNPFIPNDLDASSLPVAILRYSVRNAGPGAAKVSIAFNLENPAGGAGHDCDFRQEGAISGLLMGNSSLDGKDPLSGSFAVALVNVEQQDITYIRRWTGPHPRAGSILFWDDFKEDGRLRERGLEPRAGRVASLCSQQTIAPGKEATFTFLLAWRFPNRTPARCGWRAPKGREDEIIGNHYCTRFSDAWSAARLAGDDLLNLERRTREFVQAVRSSTLPPVVIEAAMANISTLKTQTCFRTADGRFYGFEGTLDQSGCCFGSCTHVWNYEQTTAFLFPELSRSMRESELGFNTDDSGCMSFRQMLPDGIERLGKAAADGQMGCIMKLYRDWQLSGDTGWLRTLWPKAKKALEFAWIPNGWDADRDGVMEGVQHNTYDVEFSGPNPQCGVWYLGALRAASEMAGALGDAASAAEYRRLYENGRRWIDANLFNGEYYQQQVRAYPPGQVPPSLVSNPAGAARIEGRPPFQVGDGCLIDQLVGQYFAHITGLSYLLDPENVGKAIRSVFRYNFKTSLEEHESLQRVFAVNDEAATLICSFPKGNRPEVPFWFASETMTGFEYAAAVHLACEGAVDEAVQVIGAVRERYDGDRRNPWNEAECGHHYSRAMAIWACIPALTGFWYSGVSRKLSFGPRLRRGAFRGFWSAPGAWGVFSQQRSGARLRVRITVGEGSLGCGQLHLAGLKQGSALRAQLGGKNVPCRTAAERDGLLVTFNDVLRISPAEPLEIIA